jgi:hypothetical protein
MPKTITMTLKPRKPRNPFVAAALRRKAGEHRPRRGATRRRSQVALQRELDLLHPSP